MNINAKIIDLEMKIKQMQNELQELKGQETTEELTTAETLKKLYQEDFEEFYRECKRHDEFLINNDYNKNVKCWWDMTADDDVNIDNKWARIAYAVGSFDDINVAKQIEAINNAYAQDESLPYIAMYQCKNIYKAEEIRSDLKRSIKSVIDMVLAYGEADEEENYKSYQDGRIHLDSIYYKTYDTNQSTGEKELIENKILQLYFTLDYIRAGASW